MKENLECSLRLRKAGFTEKLVEAHVRSLGDFMEFMEKKFLTKDEFKFELFRIDKRFEDLERKIEDMERKITLKLGFMMTLQLGAIATFFSFFK